MTVPFDEPQRPAYVAALRMLASGDASGAEESLIAQVQSAAAHEEIAAAESDRGRLLARMGRPSEAAAAFRRAISHSEGVARLAAQARLGAALAAAGEPLAGEGYLDQALTGWLAHHASGHPFEAAIHEALAEVYLRHGRSASALASAGAAARIYWATGHPRVADALVLRGFILRGAGSTATAFPGLDALPEAVAERAGRVAVARTRELPPRAARETLAELAKVLARRLGADHPVTLSTLAAQAEAERQGGSHSRRIEVLTRLVAAQTRAGDPTATIQARQALAMAYGDDGQAEQALSHYDAALQIARQLRQPALQASVLRNAGLYESEIGWQPQAEAHLRGAVAAARAAGDGELMARCQIALACVLIRGGQRDAANHLLRDAQRRLEPLHPESIAARQLLQPESDANQVLSRAFEEVIRSHGAGRIVESVEASIVGPSVRVAVKPKIAPSSGERTALGRLLRSTIGRFRELLHGQR